MKLPYGFPPSVFVPVPLAITATPADWRVDDSLKRAFGIALKKFKIPFEAACQVFGNETNKALYAAANWINDPITIKSRDEEPEDDEDPEKLLDFDEYCKTLLAISKEKVVFNGNIVYAAEAKDRIRALELYGKAKKFLNEKAIEVNNNNNVQNRFVEIQFVEPEKKADVKVIEHAPVEQVEDFLDNSDIELKLVG